MDLSKSKQFEVGALIKGYNHLLTISEDAVCDFDRDPMPNFRQSEYLAAVRPPKLGPYH